MSLCSLVTRPADADTPHRPVTRRLAEVPRPSVPVPARSSSRPAASTRHAGSRFRWRWAWPSWPGRAGVVPALRAAPPPSNHWGGSRPGQDNVVGRCAPGSCCVPPAPVGGAGRVKEKGIAAAAAGRGPRRPVGPGPRPVARPALLAGGGRHRAGRSHCISGIVNVSIPNAGVAKNPQETGDFRGFRLEAIGRIVVYWCSVRGHRGPGMKVARERLSPPAGRVRKLSWSLRTCPP
jgi:hypothetical protein